MPLECCLSRWQDQAVCTRDKLYMVHYLAITISTSFSTFLVLSMIDAMLNRNASVGYNEKASILMEGATSEKHSLGYIIISNSQ